MVILSLIYAHRIFHIAITVTTNLPAPTEHDSLGLDITLTATTHITAKTFQTQTLRWENDSVSRVRRKFSNGTKATGISPPNLISNSDFQFRKPKIRSLTHTKRFAYCIRPTFHVMSFICSNVTQAVDNQTDGLSYTTHTSSETQSRTQLEDNQPCTRLQVQLRENLVEKPIPSYVGLKFASGRISVLQQLNSTHRSVHGCVCHQKVFASIYTCVHIDHERKHATMRTE
uniref:Uncharacterized protein n=1 Tax=Glossina pallidipes TaxID=7398 RepID=A0A1A9ZUQ7_GLOPL